MAFYTFNDISITGISAAVPPGKIATSEQTASDLGFVAANELLSRKGIAPDEIGALIFVSKTPDYRSPATATVLLNRLKINVNCIAYDINIGGAGFIYGLHWGCSLLRNINKSFALVVMGDTTSKQLPDDHQLLQSFGDGAATILLEKKKGSRPVMIQLMADGDGVSSFILPGGGFRPAFNKDELSVNEKEMHDLATTKVPPTLNGFLEKVKAKKTDYDLFAFSQENESLIKAIAGKSGISIENIPINLSKFGNTAGCSIPLVLCETLSDAAKKELHILACGWGEGFSWGVADFFLNTENVFSVLETGEVYDNGTVSRDF